MCYCGCCHSCNIVYVSVTNGNSQRTLDNFALIIPSSTHEAQFAPGTSQMPRNQWVDGRSQKAELISAPSGLIQRRCRRKTKFSAKVIKLGRPLEKSSLTLQKERVPTAGPGFRRPGFLPHYHDARRPSGLEPKSQWVHGGPSGWACLLLQTLKRLPRWKAPGCNGALVCQG